MDMQPREQKFLPSASAYISFRPERSPAHHTTPFGWGTDEEKEGGRTREVVSPLPGRVPGARMEKARDEEAEVGQVNKGRR
jgi:hypothetical protein